MEPADAAEALILGGCASPEAIVLELVAQGGYSVVEAVTSRALLLGGAETERGIVAAVAAGFSFAEQDITVTMAMSGEGAPARRTRVITSATVTVPMSCRGRKAGGSSLVSTR